MTTTRSSKSFAGIAILVMLMTTGCGALRPIEYAPSGRERAWRQGRVSPVYHDFDDVLIPGELKPNRRTSSVSQTETFPAGLLSLNGKIDIETSAQFFKSNMAKDNWRSAGGVNAPRPLLVFEKGNRWCVIVMTADGYGTQVDIWVAPKNN